jgi:hypothetical protein
MVLRVKEGFSFDHRGVPVTLRTGELLEDTDPWVKGHEAQFEPAESSAVRPLSGAAVETATAGPAERRAFSKPLKRDGGEG